MLYSLAFMVLGGLVGGLVIDVAMVIAVLGAPPDFPGDRPRVGIADFRLMLYVPLLGIVYGLPASVPTLLLSTLFRLRLTGAPYVLACSLTGAVIAGLEGALISRSFGYSMAFAAAGGLAALAAGWSTQPRI